MIAAPLEASDGHHGYSSPRGDGADNLITDTESRSWIDDKPGRARSLVKNKTLAVHAGASVRRLTPRECERLQGFPDDWTQLGGTPDSRRYAALGDAVTVNVAEWLGVRLLAAGPESEGE